MIVPKETDHQLKEKLRASLKSMNEKFISELGGIYFSRTTKKYHLINIWWIEHIYSWSDAREFGEITEAECKEQFYSIVEIDLRMSKTEVYKKLGVFLSYLKEQGFHNSEVFRSYNI